MDPKNLTQEEADDLYPFIIEVVTVGHGSYEDNYQYDHDSASNLRQAFQLVEDFGRKLTNDPESPFRVRVWHKGELLYEQPKTMPAQAKFVYSFDCYVSVRANTEDEARNRLPDIERAIEAVPGCSFEFH